MEEETLNYVDDLLEDQQKFFAGVTKWWRVIEKWQKHILDANMEDEALDYVDDLLEGQ